MTPADPGQFAPIIADLDDETFDAARIALTAFLADWAVIEAQMRIAAARAVLDGLAAAG